MYFMTMRWIPAKSEVIKAYAYNIAERKLRVRFKSGKIYDYDDVDPRTFAEYVTSESQGAYLNQKIKPGRAYHHVH
jgi:hypothetical protein